jgi:hypothetical protein
VVFGGRYLDEGLEVFAARPGTGIVEGGQVVRLAGRGFTGGERVYFGGREAVVLEVPSTAELSVRVPGGAAPGAVDVEVVRAGARAVLGAGFEYTPAARFPDLVLSEEYLGSGAVRLLQVRGLPETTRGVYSFLQVHLGDLNGDAVDDLVIPMGIAGPEQRGEVTVVLGRPGLEGSLYVRDEDLDGRSVFRIRGESGFWGLGFSTGFPGDLDGDGMGDVLVGDATDVRGTLEDFAAGRSGGRSYVFFGRREWPAVVEPAEEFFRGGAALIENLQCGSSVAGLGGDLDADGSPDLLVGSSSTCVGSDSRLRIFRGPFERGEWRNELDVAPDAVAFGNPYPLVACDGLQAWDPPTFGTAAAGLGDVNGDGRADFAVGAVGIWGEVYIVLGGEDLRSLDGAVIGDLVEAGRAVWITAPKCNSEIGLNVSALGDFNGDGLADLLIGLRGGGLDFEGEVYVVLGSRELGESVRVLELAQGGPGVVQIVGESSFDFSGSASPVGDLDGDGLADLGITGYYGRHVTARACVIFGQREPPARIDLGELGPLGFRLSLEGLDLFAALQRGVMAGGDLDGDGARDLAFGVRIGEEERAIVLFGGGQGAPQSPFPARRRSAGHRRRKRLGS